MLGQGAWLVPENSVSDGTIRVIFKIYLVAIVLATALVGGRALRLLIRNRLLQGQSVTLPTTTGWLSGGSLGSTMLKLRRLPGGPLGWAMVLFTALNIACDLSVAKAISKVFWPGRDSSSTYGMIIDTEQTYNHYPDITNGAYQRAFVAQYYAQQNLYTLNRTLGGYGIYRYIPYNDEVLFMPGQEDIIGSWDCSQTNPQPIVYDGQSQGVNENITGIIEDLIGRGLMYNETDADGVPIWVASFTTGGENSANQTVWPTHLVAFTWDTAGSNTPLSYKIAVDIQDINPTTGAKAINTYQCDLQAYDNEKTVFQVAKAINISYATLQYKDAIGGGLYPSLNSGESLPTDAIPSGMAYYLNSMIMVAGSGQSTQSPNTQGYTYGVIMIVTIVPDWVLALCAVFGLAAIILAIATGILWSKSKSLRRKYDSSGAGTRIPSDHIVEHAPVGLLDWTKYATYRAGNGTLDLSNFKERDWVMTTQASRSDVIDIVSRKHNLEAGDTAVNSSEEDVQKAGVSRKT